MRDNRISTKGTNFARARAESWKVLVCRACGKQLDHYWPSRWFGKEPAPPPEWVTGGDSVLAAET